MRITDVRVDRYGPLRPFAHECGGDFEVFYGPNESGKTLLLEAVLKLLTPDVGDAMGGIDRVEETPTGHVVLEANGSEEKLGDGTALGDVIGVTPRHLRNVFVIRDSDLRLADEHAFYDSITQEIGDIHTNEIEAIKEQLVESGRLTSVGGRDLSAAMENDEAADVRDEAAELAGDIRDYVADAEAADVAAAEREYVAVTSDLRECERGLDRQESAERLATHDTLTDRLETYRSATRKLTDDVSRDTLERLESLQREAQRAEEAIDDLERECNELRTDRRTHRTECERLEAEIQPMADRASRVEAVDDELATFREARTESIGSTRSMDFAKYVAVASVAGAGAAAGLGNAVVGFVLATAAFLATGWFALQHRNRRRVAHRRERLLQAARDAGFDVGSVEEIPPAISSFEDELAELRRRLEDREQKLAVAKQMLEERETELRERRTGLRDHREEIADLLGNADVPDVETYRERVEAREEREQARDQAAQSLADSLGEPGDGTEDPEATIEYWKREVDELVADVDESIDPSEYDPERLDDLQEEHETLTERRETLANRLDEHEEQLRAFDDSIASMAARPFLDEPVSLPSRSIEGLRAAADELDRLVECIERDADVAREALSIFDEIQAAEEQKITDLFGPESRATSVFRRITDGRYSRVTYDATEKVLQVHRDGNEVLTPRKLSHGATDQLYLAARIGLADKLLSAEPGFFIMDDAFLPADRTRLREGFEVLQALADEGWQILYFTAKDEVGVDLVDDLGLARRDVDLVG